MQNNADATTDGGDHHLDLVDTVEHVREKLGFGSERDRQLDDEMQRPPDDRSPLT